MESREKNTCPLSPSSSLSALRGRRAALHNLGCKVNAYETEAMQQMLERSGCRIVPFDEDADIYVINTCSVTNIADRKSRQMLHRAKKKNPNAVIVAAGCYVQTAKEKTGLALEADIIIGNNKKGELSALLEAWFREEKEPISSWEENGGGSDYEALLLTRTAEHTRAYMKVQDGCNQFCSYCIIPYARGRARSRSEEQILKEAASLAEHGIQELVLTGIHLSSYGKDTGTDLLSLIRACAKVPGIRRIRLGSLEPNIITPEFAHALKQIPEVCPHFHLSLQSGCDDVLRRMNRHYTTQEYLEKCQLLREVFDDPAITTDIIVGFPGETEEMFETTCAFLAKAQFYETHIFRYSRREGTRAAAMEGQLTEAVKADRSDRLSLIQENYRRAYEARWEGREAETLLEEKVHMDGTEYYTGHTREYIRVLCPAASLRLEETGSCVRAEGMSGKKEAEREQDPLVGRIVSGKLSRPDGSEEMLIHPADPGVMCS